VQRIKLMNHARNDAAAVGVMLQLLHIAAPFSHKPVSLELNQSIEKLKTHWSSTHVLHKLLLPACLPSYLPAYLPACSPADASSSAADLKTNFESDKPSSWYSHLYQKDGLVGGHAIMLSKDEDSRQTALEALRAWPGGLQLGGGIDTENAMEYLDAGASHVIVTSFVFREGRLDEERLKALVSCWWCKGRRMEGCRRHIWHKLFHHDGIMRG
jgi:hypothetical protein